jgi:FkbM family methyltransferase
MTIYVDDELRLGTTTRRFHYRKLKSDEVVITQILIDQHYDLGRIKRGRELHAFVKRRVAMGLRPLIVDAGANIGASPVYFAANFPEALVVAIEPDIENFRLMSRNVEGLNVELVHGAISSNNGRARVVDPGEGPCGYRTEVAGEADCDGNVVSRTTVDAIYRSHPPPFFPFIVKVDIEGAEADLFAANTDWVARTPLLIVELHDWLLPKAGTSRTFLRCISQLDRDFVYVGENVFSIANDLDG